jgi:hypothetical protein
MVSSPLRWIALAMFCVAPGCYSEPSIADTEDGSSSGSGPGEDGDGDGDGDGASTTMAMSTSASTTPPGGSDDSGGPGSTGAMPPGTTDTGSDESTGAVVGSDSSSGGLETTGDGSSSDDATTGPVVPDGQCNEMLGVPCDGEQFCDYPDDMCGAGSHGVCQMQPMVCNLILQPSCGCNGSNYSNPCVATANGTDFAHFGNC